MQKRKVVRNPNNTTITFSCPKEMRDMLTKLAEQADPGHNRNLSGFIRRILRDATDMYEDESNGGADEN